MYRPILFNLLVFAAGVVSELEDRYCDSMLDINAEVDPLPLVPAIWIAFSLFKSTGYGYNKCKSG